MKSEEELRKEEEERASIRSSFVFDQDIDEGVSQGREMEEKLLKKAEVPF